MKNILLFAILFVTCAAYCNGCSTTHNHLYTHECDEMEKHPTGSWFTTDGPPKDGKQTKKIFRRAVTDITTCSTVTVEYMKMKDDSVHTLKPHRVAGAFMYRYFTQQEKVFWGIKNTYDAIKERKTMNIIIDRAISFYVLTLRDKSGSGPNTIKMVSSDELENPDTIPKDKLIERCQNLFDFLFQELGSNQGYSVTLTDLTASNFEYRFYYISGGIGGFYSA